MATKPQQKTQGKASTQNPSSKNMGWDESTTWRQTADDPTRKTEWKSRRPFKDFKGLEQDPSGRACPDCHTQLFFEKGRSDLLLCLGCGADPEEFYHYVTRGTIAVRQQKLDANQVARDAMLREHRMHLESRAAILAEYAEYMREDAGLPLDLPISSDLPGDDLPL